MVRNSGLGPDPDQSAKNGPELGTRSGLFCDAPGMTEKTSTKVIIDKIHML